MLDAEKKQIMDEEYERDQILKADYYDSVLDSMSSYELRNLRCFNGSI